MSGDNSPPAASISNKPSGRLWIIHSSSVSPCTRNTASGRSSTPKPISYAQTNCAGLGRGPDEPYQMLIFTTGRLEFPCSPRCPRTIVVEGRRERQGALWDQGQVGDDRAGRDEARIAALGGS